MIFNNKGKMMKKYHIILYKFENPSGTGETVLTLNSFDKVKLQNTFDEYAAKLTDGQELEYSTESDKEFSPSILHVENIKGVNYIHLKNGRKKYKVQPSNKLESIIRETIDRIKTEGKDELVPFVVKYTYIDFSSKTRKTGTVHWDLKNDGKPNIENLKKWRTKFNTSIESGANKHLSKTHSSISKCWIVNQKTGQTIAEYNPPMFYSETIDRIKTEAPLGQVKRPTAPVTSTTSADAIAKQSGVKKVDIQNFLQKNGIDPIKLLNAIRQPKGYLIQSALQSAIKENNPNGQYTKLLKQKFSI